MAKVQPTPNEEFINNVINTDSNVQPDISKRFITSLDDFGALQEVKVEQFYCSTIDRTVYLRAPDASRRGLFEGQIASNKPMREFQKMQFCAMCLCDENGKFLFPEILDYKNIKKVLGGMDSRFIEELSIRCIDLMRITEEEIEERIKK